MKGKEKRGSKGRMERVEDERHLQVFRVKGHRKG